MSSSKERKLAVILFADIVGYTAFMENNEDLAFQMVQKFRKTLNKNVRSHKGQVIQYYGDGCVCTFENAVDAMTCAKEIQQIFQNTPKVPVHIGLHNQHSVLPNSKFCKFR